MNASVSASDYLTLLNILVAFFGVILVAGLGIEWVMLRSLRKRLKGTEKRLQREFYDATKAAHKIISSYGMKDVNARIALLESATAEAPEAYNAWNALGYAFIEKGDLPAAIEAFTRGIAVHPEDKAGYCDLAAAYLLAGNGAAAIRNCKKAVEIDPSARNDILSDPRFDSIKSKI